MRKSKNFQLFIMQSTDNGKINIYINPGSIIPKYAKYPLIL